MPGNTLASRTMNLNFVNLLARILLASDWFKSNQLLSELTHAHHREPVPLIHKVTCALLGGFGLKERKIETQIASAVLYPYSTINSKLNTKI